MKVSSSRFLRISISILFLFAGSGVQALDTNIILQADTEITPTNNELITFGLPIAEGQVSDLNEIKVMVGSTELPVYVESGLRYHWLDNSFRSVTVQLNNIDMTGGNVTVRITDEGAGVARSTERPHSDGWATAGANKNNLPYPRIFALHDKEYLAQSGVVSPYEVAPDSPDAFEDYRSAQFENWAGGLDYSTSSQANWLFDRSTAMFKSYLATGRVEFLKEAFLSKQFYFSYVLNDGSEPSKSGGSGCWTYGTVACNDGKYIYTQHAKLAWALVGDNSQWDDALIANMAFQADVGNYQSSTRDEFDGENEAFTERAAGLVGLSEINAFEITANATVFTHLTERINSLKDMQQTEKQWDLDNGWTPKSGAWTHNINVHEGASASLGATNERGFSVWMSENIVEFLWQTYWVTGNSDIPEMLRLLSNAIELYGFTSSYNPSTQGYDTKSGYDEIKAQSCNTTREATEMLYFSSAFADEVARTDSDWWKWYTDNHNIQSVLTLSAGYYFETDENIRTRLKARIEKLIEGWSNADCANISVTPRLWNWQHRSNSVRTWHWVADISNAGGIDEVVITSPPASPGGLVGVVLGGGNSGQDSGGGSGGSGGSIDDVAVFIASTECAVGDDPHWECGGHWVSYGSVEADDLIAVCPGAEAPTYVDCFENDLFKVFADVTAQDGILFCAVETVAEFGRSGCPDPQWAFTENLADLGAGGAVGSNDGGSDDGGSDDGGSDDGGAADDGGDDNTSDTGLIFENVIESMVPGGTEERDNHFWVGAPDVNNDGCIDLYVAEHRDGGHDENNVPTDDINSAMYIHKVVDGHCENEWTLYRDVENYSQSSPQTPRITANNMWGNFTGNEYGFWSFGGIDADGSDPAFYEIDYVNEEGEPFYKAKRGSNCGSRHLCMYGDFTGDGDIDLLRADRESEESTLVVNDETGEVLIEVDADVGEKGLDAVNLMFDVNGDGWPDIYVVKEGGYWKNNEGSSFSWVGNLHPEYGNPSGTDTERRNLNHQLTLDYDNDGDQDLLGNNGQDSVDGVFCFKLYRNNNTDSWDDVTATSGLDGCPANSESFWTIPYSNSTIGDLNLDGFMDVVMFGETYGNTATLLINNGDGSFTIDRGIEFGFAYNTSGVGKSHGQIRDVDGDGLPDIIKTQDQSGADHHAFAVWKNKTVTNNRWLTVRTRGLGENTDGIHTYLTVYKPNTATVVTSFEINTRFGNEYLIPTLGMAENDTVDVKVTYPHGGPEYLIEDLSTNQSIIIFYDGCVDEGVQGGSRLPVNSSEASCDRNLGP